MKRTLLTAALMSAALSTSAFAQTATTATPAAPAATSMTDGKIVAKGNWRASKLMGLDIYNASNEKLGDINELIVDANGKITAVVIGVGGFLGMGEHDIAVTIDKLKFVEEPMRTSATTTMTTPAPAPIAAPAGSTTSTGAPAATTGATTTTTTTTAATSSYDWTPDHAVMNATKDQLKAMPQFKYSDYN